MDFYLLMFLSNILSNKHGWPYILKSQHFLRAFSTSSCSKQGLLLGTVSTRVGLSQWVLS